MVTVSWCFEMHDTIKQDIVFMKVHDTGLKHRAHSGRDISGLRVYEQ